jgi:hypothetical protein
LHDGAIAYNAFTWLNIEHEKFHERDYAEQGLKILASTDFHFPWNTDNHNN